MFNPRMGEHFNESAYPQFSAAVQANMAAGSVPVGSIELHIAGAEATLRLRGAFLTRLALRDKQGRRHEVLYTDADDTKPNMPASHVMLPVGPYDGAGGQHGFARWVDYRDAIPGVPRLARRLAGLHAETLDLPMELHRTVALHGTCVSLMTRAINKSKRPVRTSAGEHLYFALPEGVAAADVLIRKGTIDTLAYPGASDQIAQGEVVFWPGYGGRPLRVDIPDGPSFNLDTIVHGGGARPEDIGLLLWQRPGEPFICIGPTVGYRHGGQPVTNTGVLMAERGGVLAMTTTMTMQ